MANAGVCCIVAQWLQLQTIDLVLDDLGGIMYCRVKY